MNHRIAVIGASGFVGSAVSQALTRRGHEVVPIPAPRLAAVGERARFSAEEVLETYMGETERLASCLSGVSAVVNCAGIPDASSRDAVALDRVNGDLVAVIAAATTRGAISRFVHVSSAVVQGRLPILDDSFRYDPFSAYARSKIRGEQLILHCRSERSVIYRPPSVHAPGRRVTEMTAKIARSPFASVASPPGAPTPQALLENVADAVAFLATCEQNPPLVVIHPWEGLTTAGLLRALSGKDPKVLPRPLAKAITAAATAVGRATPKVAANARRAEMIWFGQVQAESWLTNQGWTPPTAWSNQQNFRLLRPTRTCR